MAKETAEQITQKLLALSVNERAYIADCLLESLTESDLKGFKQSEEFSSEWVHEIRNRIKEFEDGTIETENTFQIINELREELRQRYAHPAAS